MEGLAQLLPLMPFLYIFVGGLALGIYIRRKYGEPYPERCNSCPLRRFCEATGLNRIPPLKIKRVPRKFLWITTLSLSSGYLAVTLLVVKLSHTNILLYLGPLAALLAMVGQLKNQNKGDGRP